MVKEFYTMQEFADVFVISKRCVVEWVKSGKVKSIKIGRTVRIPRSEVERLAKGE